MFPGFRGAGFPEDPPGFFLLAGGRMRQYCDLAPVKEPLPDAVVLLRLAQCVGPSACLAQGAEAVGEQDSPQPLRECLAGGGGERGEADGPAVDYRAAASMRAWAARRRALVMSLIRDFSARLASG